jgi:hypothetical protein
MNATPASLLSADAGYRGRGRTTREDSARNPWAQGPLLARNIAMSKVVAIMSMSLDDYVADLTMA